MCSTCYYLKTYTHVFYTHTHTPIRTINRRKQSVWVRNHSFGLWENWTRSPLSQPFSVLMWEPLSYVNIKVLNRRNLSTGKGSPGGGVVKNLHANAGDTNSIPGLERSHGGGVPLPGESHEQRSLEGYSPWGHKESDTTDHAREHTHTHTHAHTLSQTPNRKLYATSQ